MSPTTPVKPLDRVNEHLRGIKVRVAEATAARDRAAVREAIEQYADVDASTQELVCEVKPVDIVGTPGEWHLGGPRAAPARMLYIHGGGWTAGSLASHRAQISRIAQACAIPVLAVEYRLAPEHPFPAGLEDCVKACLWLRDNAPGGLGGAAKIVIAGDSAGGNLAFATMLAMRNRGAPLPDLAVAISPATDFTASGESVQSKLEDDPIIDARNVTLIKKAYARDRDAKDPLISPLFADLAGLPPALVQVGECETLLDDSRRMADRLKAAKVDVTLEVWPKMPHAWHAFAPYLPEAGEAVDKIGRFVRDRV